MDTVTADCPEQHEKRSKERQKQKQEKTREGDMKVTSKFRSLDRPLDVRTLSEGRRPLGWLSGTSKQHDGEVLDFLAAVRAKDLQLRYD